MRSSYLDIAPLYSFKLQYTALAVLPIVILGYVVFGNSLFKQTDNFIFCLNIILSTITFSKEKNETEDIIKHRYMALKSSFMVLIVFIVVLGYIINSLGLDTSTLNFNYFGLAFLLYYQLIFRVLYLFKKIKKGAKFKI